MNAERPLRTPISGTTIDLNCDLGECENAAQIAIDAALLDIVTSANIACGGHAGDQGSMQRTVREAIRRGVAIGAHPSYPDRADFGRKEMPLSAIEIEHTVRDQVMSLRCFVAAERGRLAHVKPHGALYHAAMTKPEVAEAVARGVRSINAALVLVGLAGTKGIEAWRSMGMATAAEAFADRCYEANGWLRSRTLPGAVLDDPGAASEQALRIATEQGVISMDGSVVAVEAETICIHSDTPGALSVARAVRERLEGAGILVRALA